MRFHNICNLFKHNLGFITHFYKYNCLSHIDINNNIFVAVQHLRNTLVIHNCHNKRAKISSNTINSNKTSRSLISNYLKGNNLINHLTFRIKMKSNSLHNNKEEFQVEASNLLIKM